MAGSETWKPFAPGGNVRQIWNKSGVENASSLPCCSPPSLEELIMADAYIMTMAITTWRNLV